MRERIGERVMMRMKADRESGIDRDYSEVFFEAYQEMLEEVFVSAKLLHMEQTRSVDGGKGS